MAWRKPQLFLEQWLKDQVIRLPKVLLFQEGGAIIINKLSFPLHQDRGKDQVMMASNADMEVEGDGAVQPESEPDLDHIAH